MNKLIILNSRHAKFIVHNRLTLHPYNSIRTRFDTNMNSKYQYSTSHIVFHARQVGHLACHREDNCVYVYGTTRNGGKQQQYYWLLSTRVKLRVRRKKNILRRALHHIDFDISYIAFFWCNSTCKQQRGALEQFQVINANIKAICKRKLNLFVVKQLVRKRVVGIWFAYWIITELFIRKKNWHYITDFSGLVVVVEPPLR